MELPKYFHPSFDLILMHLEWIDSICVGVHRFNNLQSKPTFSYLSQLKKPQD